MAEAAGAAAEEALEGTGEEIPAEEGSAAAPAAPT